MLPCNSIILPNLDDQSDSRPLRSRGNRLVILIFDHGSDWTELHGHFLCLVQHSFQKHKS